MLSIRRMLVVMILALLSACAADAPPFVPPAERPTLLADQPWPTNQFIGLAYHDVEDDDPDQRFLSVRTDRLVEQLTWLRSNDYHAVSIDQILAARDGGAPLPERAVLLSFDDGYKSFSTRVLPVLRAFNWPAVLAPVGAWMDTPADQRVNFGGEMVERERFLNWSDVREIHQSGLVEIAAHTNNSHFGARANPQGNSQPVAAIRIYDPQTGTYESEAAYNARLAGDITAISAKIKSATGRAPRVWIWPYGAESGTALHIAGAHGYEVAMTLEDGTAKVDALMSSPRMLLSSDPGIRMFANAVIGTETRPMMRVAHVDLDYVYDPDPAQTDRNLGVLVQRILDMQINTVFLQAFADPDANSLVKSVYFPNRWLPVRADLFNRAAWQLRNRANVQLYAWMPVLSFDLDPGIARVERWDPQTQATRIDPDQYARLSPFDPKARRQITDLYEDLARYAIFDGIIFHDDAVLTDFEDAGPLALQAYGAAGLPDSVAALRANPEIMTQWARFKSQYLVDFTLELAAHVKAIRGPRIKTARNIFAAPILNPESETWFAQNLDDFLAAYDWTAPMAMPLMEGVTQADSGVWLDRLVDIVATRRGALNRTVFELQARDWRSTPAQPDGKPIDTTVIAAWMKRLQARGARNFGYYPDDFLQNHPALEGIRPAISDSWYPVR